MQKTSKNKLQFLFRTSNFPACQSAGRELRTYDRGFTLIETLVAIAILLLAISAPLSIAEKGLASAEAARSEITAFYLAQEALEFVRNARDSSVIAGDGWLDALQACIRDNPADETGGCGIDPSNLGQQIRTCSTPEMNGCIMMQYTANDNPDSCSQSVLCGVFGHRYPQAGWTATDFVRRVFIDEIEVNGDDDEAKITVKLDWKAGSLGSRTIRVSEDIFNWYTAP